MSKAPNRRLDEATRFLARIEAAKSRFKKARQEIAFWRPNDRPFKVASAELSVLEAYLTEIERSVKRSAKSINGLSWKEIAKLVLKNKLPEELRPGNYDEMMARSHAALDKIGRRPK